MTFEKREQIWGHVVAAAFSAHELPAEWGLAICKQESNFDPLAVAGVHTASCKGGTFGLMQITYGAAREMGFDDRRDKLLNPVLNCALAAKLCTRWALRHPDSLEDVYCRFRSGKPRSHAPGATLANLRKVLRYAYEYKNRLTEFTP